MAKIADFGADFAKIADFIVTGNSALSELLVALEEVPAEQAGGAFPEVSKRAQRTRHILETMRADWAKLAEQIRARGNGSDQESSPQTVHVHVHLHLNTETGAVTPRVDR